MNTRGDNYMNMMWVCGYVYKDLERRVEESLQPSDMKIFTITSRIPISLLTCKSIRSYKLSKHQTRLFKKYVVDKLRRTFHAFDIEYSSDFTILYGDTVDIKFVFKSKDAARWMTIEEVENILGYKIKLYTKS